MAVRVRSATPADAAAIARLARELSAHQGDPTDLFTEATVLRDGFGAAREFTVIVAEEDERAGEAADRVVGYALFHPCYETGHAARGLYLNDLYVQADSRGRGVGRALVGAVAAEARRGGRTYVWWASKAWNTEAQAAYRALGAIEEPVRAHAVLHAVFDELADTAAQGNGKPVG